MPTGLINLNYRELPCAPGIKSLTIQRLKQLFTQKLYTHDKLAKLAISLPPTQNLSARNQGYIPLDAVTQLLKTRQFSSNGIVNVAEWIENQLQVCELPLHETLISLLDYFIRANVPESKKEFKTCQAPMDYARLAELAANQKASLVSRALAAYYLVALANQLMKNANVVFRDEFHFSKRIPFPYEALRKVPVKDGPHDVITTLPMTS